jgi:hypothetical protein
MRKAWEARHRKSRLANPQIRMIGFDGRLQWRQHRLFKLRAKPRKRKKDMNYIML